MPRFKIGEIDVMVIDNELWHKVVASRGDGVADEVLPAKRKPKTRTKGGGDYEAIKADLRVGMKLGVVAIKHNVPYWKVNYAKKQMNEAGELIEKPDKTLQDPKDPSLKTYQCVKNHHFTSTAPQNEAMCHCGAKAFREIKNSIKA